jgi:hypothetical protein
MFFSASRWEKTEISTAIMLDPSALRGSEPASFEAMKATI